jgi:hypothetical protein
MITSDVLHYVFYRDGREEEKINRTTGATRKFGGGQAMFRQET